MYQFVLASKSPRRQQLLLESGYDFKIVPSTICEDENKNLRPEVFVETLALKKARDVFLRENFLTLAADTIVVLDGEILGKPADRSENEAFLKRLSDKSHFVFTGYALKNAEKEVYGFCRTEVIFNRLSDELISDYVSKGLGLDKAGGYGIQNDYPFVKQYIGSFTNVIGLPMEKINGLLKELL